MFYPRTIIKRTVSHIKGQIVEDVLAAGVKMSSFSRSAQVIIMSVINSF